MLYISVYGTVLKSVFKMAAVSLAAQPNSFDYGKYNLTENCCVINAFCNIENSQRKLISCEHLAFMHHDFNVTPRMEI